MSEKRPPDGMICRLGGFHFQGKLFYFLIKYVRIEKAVAIGGV